MIHLKGIGATYGEVWYDEEPPANAGVDIVIHRQRPAPIAGARCAPFLSLVTDLTEDKDRMFARFTKDCRYKIRRAESKDGLTLEFLTEPESRIEEFRSFFDAFAAQKGIGLADRDWLIASSKAGRLTLASASRDGEPLVWHASVTYGDSITLQYSGSCFRNRENDYRALVGRANRWLHWSTMLRFKEMGLKRYDWGGLFEDESQPDRAGINDFKRSFGGRQERTYYCTVPVTLRGRVYLPLREFWRRRRIRLSLLGAWRRRLRVQPAEVI